MAALFTLEQIVATEMSVPFTAGSLANGSSAVSTASYNNVNGGTSGLSGYKRGKFRFSGTLGAAPSPSSGIAIYAVKGNSTGATFETSNVSPPPNLAIAVIAFDSTNATQTRDSDDVDLPGGYFEILVYNNSGQTISSGWTLTLEPITDGGF